jgi:hypothetical protein
VARGVCWWMVQPYCQFRVGPILINLYTRQVVGTDLQAWLGIRYVPASDGVGFRRWWWSCV